MPKPQASLLPGAVELLNTSNGIQRSLQHPCIGTATPTQLLPLASDLGSRPNVPWMQHASTSVLTCTTDTQQNPTPDGGESPQPGFAKSGPS